MDQSKFTSIHGLSEILRLPRLGKIRLGIKVKPEGGKEYPKETDYFVVPSEVAEVCGEKPKELEIMLPINDVSYVFPQRLVWFGASRGIKCIGNNKMASRIEEPGGERHTDWQERSCPCDLFEKGCFRRASLLILLPKVSMGGIYQVDMSSYNSIVNINSGIKLTEKLVGRFALIPLKLKRVPVETYGSRGKEIHHILYLVFEGNINLVNQLRGGISKDTPLLQYAIDEPELENPEFDDVPTETDATEAAKNAGMVPGEDAPSKTTQPPPSQSSRGGTENDQKILVGFKRELDLFKGTDQERMKWFNIFRKTPALSNHVVQESTRLYNEKVEELKKAKKQEQG